MRPVLTAAGLRRTRHDVCKATRYAAAMPCEDYAETFHHCAYLGMPSCVVSLHEMSSDSPGTSLLVKRAATIAIHEIGHKCGLDHHGYDDGIACVMTADTELDCLDRLDEGTHRFCRACQHVVDRKLAH